MNIIKALKEAFGGSIKAAEQAAKARFPGIKLEQLTEEQAKSLVTTKMPRPERIEPPISKEEAETFGRAIEQGSGVAREFGEESSTLRDAAQRRLSQGRELTEYIPPGKLSTIGKMKGEGVGENIIDVEAWDAAPRQLKAGAENVIYAGPGTQGARYNAEGVEAASPKINYPSPTSKLEDLKEALTLKQKLAMGAGAAGLTAGIAGTLPDKEDAKKFSDMPKVGKEIFDVDLSRYPGEHIRDYVPAGPGRPYASWTATPFAGKVPEPSKEPSKGRGPFAEVSKYEKEVLPRSAVKKEPGKEIKTTPSVSPAAVVAPALAEEEPPVEAAEKAPSLMEKLQEERLSAKAEREAAMQKADIGELASIIGRGLAQIGAAASGMRSGVDMSNIAKESLIDWDKRREQIMAAYKQNISEIDTQQARLERAEERTQDKAEKEAYRKQQLKLEYDKLRQDREIANAKRDVETLSAIAKRDKQALTANEKKINDEIAALDKQEAALRRVEELDVEGKDLKIIAGEVAKLYGKAEAEKPGFIYGTNLKSKDELRELLSAKRQEIELARQAAQKRLKTIYDYQQADVAPTPAPAPAPTASSAELAAKEARRQELLRKAGQ